MTTKWYHNSKTGEIDSYKEESAGYELKGLLYAYGDAVTLGFNTKEEALEWSKEWGYCKKCNEASSGKNNKCFRCGEEILFVKLTEAQKDETN